MATTVAQLEKKINKILKLMANVWHLDLQDLTDYVNDKQNPDAKSLLR